MITRTSAVVVALAIALAATPEVLIAQDRSEVTVKAEVRAAWDAYIEAFSAGRTDIVANDVYAAPSFQIGPSGSDVRMTTADTRARFDAVHQSLASERYARSETDRAEICVINDGAALLSAHYTRYRTDDSVISTGSSSYLFATSGGQWRIVALIANPGGKLIACD